MSEHTKIEIRPELKEFAELMERRLRKDDKLKTHWTNCRLHYLLLRLVEEVGELCKVFNLDLSVTNSLDVVMEAVDVANFAMMIADHISGDYRR